MLSCCWDIYGFLLRQYFSNFMIRAWICLARGSATDRFCSTNRIASSADKPIPINTQQAIATLRWTPYRQCTRTRYPSRITGKADSTPRCKVDIGMGTSGLSMVGSHKNLTGDFPIVREGIHQCILRIKRTFMARISSAWSPSGQAEMYR